MKDIIYYSVIVFWISMGTLGLMTIADNAFQRQNEICQEGGC